MNEPNEQPDNEPTLTIDDLVIANTLRQAWEQDLFAPVRIRKGYRTSQQQLADTLGVTRPTLSRWESGQRSPSNYWLLRWFQALARLANYKSELGPNWATELLKCHFHSDDKSGTMDKVITLRLHSAKELLPTPYKLVGVVIIGDDFGDADDIWLSCMYRDEQEAFLDTANQDIRVEVNEVDYWFYLPEV